MGPFYTLETDTIADLDVGSDTTTSRARRLNWRSPRNNLSGNRIAGNAVQKPCKGREHPIHGCRANSTIMGQGSIITSIDIHREMVIDDLEHDDLGNISVKKALVESTEIEVETVKSVQSLEVIEKGCWKDDEWRWSGARTRRRLCES
jgi:hypothetical protein